MEGELLTYQGWFDIERLPGSKKLQACTLRLDDGRVLVTAYRPVAEQIPFVERRVVVRGRHYHSDPDVQSLDADHFQIVEMALAPGQAPGPTELPRPPLVRRREALAGRDDRWVSLVATLSGGGPRPDDEMWWDAELALEDGAQVRVLVFGGTFRAEWQPLVGERVTVCGRAQVQGGRLRLVGRVAICPGEAPGCGMGVG
jgi:hypothetical protein